MTKALSSIFKKAGVEGPIHHTIYRKSAVSRCYDGNKDIASNFADLMAHRENTAQKYYRVFEKGKSLVKASQKLNTIMRSHAHHENSRHTLPAEEDCKIPDSTLDDVARSTSKRVSWNEDELAAIRSIFQEEIAAKSVTIEVVRRKIQTHPSLATKNPKRVYDRIRAEWRFVETEEEATVPGELPEEQESVRDRVNRLFEPAAVDDSSTHSSDIIPPTSGTSKGLFHESQVQTLLRLCRDMTVVAPISKPVIIARLEKDADGNILLANVTLQQIVNRLKYERKQKRLAQQKKGF